jgi:hypothetical protein
MKTRLYEITKLINLGGVVTNQNCLYILKLLTHYRNEARELRRQNKLLLERLRRAVD